MLQRLLEYIAPPQFDDEEKNQGAIILNAILLLTITVLTIAVLMIIVFVPNLDYSIFIYVMSILTVCIFYLLFRRGYVQIVRYGLIATFWALITAAVMINGGLGGPVFNAYLTLIILAALILGPRGGIVVAALNGVSAVVLFLLGEADIFITPSRQALEPIHILIINMSYFTIGALFLYVAMHTLRRNYQQIRQSEASLRQALADLQATTVSKDYVNNIIQSMSNMLIVLDRNGIIRTVNQRTVDVLGYSEDELVGKLYNALLAFEEDDPDRMSATILRRTQLVRNVEQIYQARDGRKIPVSVSSSVMYNTDQQVEGIVCVAQDITDIREAERQRQRVQAQLEYQASLLDAVSDAIIATKMDMTITSWNKAAEHVYGYKAEEVLGKNLMEIVPTRFDRASQDNLIKEQYIERGHWQNEVIQQRKGGKEINILSSIALLKDEQGRPAGTVTINHDITKRKQAEIALRKRAEELATLRQVDIEIGSTLEVNEVVKIGLDAALELSGADAGFVMLSGDDQQYHIVLRRGQYPTEQIPHYQIIKRVIQQQFPEFITDVRQDKDYVPCLPDTVSLMIIPLIYQERMIGLICLETHQVDCFNDDIFGLMQILAARVAIALDNARLYEMLQKQLIELQKLYIQVSKLEELKTDMIRLASHDLRNPVGIAKGNLALLRKDVEDLLDSEQRDFIVQIEKALDRMNDIATNILSLERIHNTVDQDFTDSVDLPKLMQQAVSQYQSSADHAGIQLTYQILPSHEPIHVLGDKSELYEAMANLINNAIKYTPSGGQVVVTLKQNGSKAAFTVEDNGYGVPKEQQSLLFQPLSRINTPETRDIEGVGLGLHLVRNIIERHRGKIIFHSVYRQGSTFGFELPIQPEV
ncbi:MAG: PAS domain S-box protein [Chloroflexi bacterium]|nr:MAG: PAS domain S-box protein [Chloroflexota bacterium]